MITQIVANTLQVIIAAGMLFQILTLARHAVRIVRPCLATKSPVRPAPLTLSPQRCAQNRVRRQRNYRLALKAARASVSA